MSYETQADFAALYRCALRDPDTQERYANFRDPAKYGDQVINITLHYHRLVKLPDRRNMAQRLVDRYGITDQDALIIFGGAYGWLGEALKDLVNCTAVSVDTSPWINASKDLSGDDELREAIIAGGLDPDTGLGKQFFDKFSDPLPRARIPVANETLSNNGSRQRVIAHLPKNPTRIITEEVWQLLTDQERTDYTARLTAFGVPVTHIIDNQIIDGP